VTDGSVLPAAPRTTGRRVTSAARRYLPAAVAFLLVAVLAAACAVYLSASLASQQRRALDARASDVVTMMRGATQVTAAAQTIGVELAASHHDATAFAGTLDTLFRGTDGVGAWLAEPTATGGRLVAHAGEPPVLVGYLTPLQWNALFHSPVSPGVPALVHYTGRGWPVVGIKQFIPHSHRVMVTEVDIGQYGRAIIGSSTLNAAVYLGPAVNPLLVLASTAPHLPITGPLAIRHVTVNGSAMTLVVGADRNTATPGWLPTAVLAAGLVIALLVATLVEEQRHRRDTALASVRLLQDRNAALDTVSGELRDTAAALAHRADHDDLTSLANRSVLHRRIAALAAAGPVGVGVFDLDDFKTINDSLGHDAGDETLRIVASRLAATVAARADAVRLGGDEFAVIMNTNNTDTLRSLALEVISAVAAPIDINGRELVVRSSLGIATWPGSTDDPAELVCDADLAMYAAKRALDEHRPGSVAVYEPAFRDAAEARLVLVTELRQALHRDQLVLHYQPLVDVASGAIVGCEALVRWAHPRHGLLGPGAFIPAAEEFGLIRQIGGWVLKRACDDLAVFRADAPTLTMSVNVSPIELFEPGYVDGVVATLAGHGLEASALQLEITERVLVDVTRALPILTDIRERGLRLALDDFGTGYSSLLYLRTLPMTSLKIDRAFLAASGDPAGRGILASLLDLARHARLEPVCEGVETEAQRVTLRRLGCSRAQGFLFARPMPREHFAAILTAAAAAA
jgi:diguanylate cyclase (GGDEF)-like protein